MDAKRLLALGGAGLLGVLWGCYPMYEGPATQRPQPAPVKSRQPLATVADEGSRPAPPGDDAESLNRLVQGYVDRIDDVGRRVLPPPPPVEQVGHAQQLPSRPGLEVGPPTTEASPAEPTSQPAAADPPASPLSPDLGPGSPTSAPTTQPSLPHPPVQPPLLGSVSVRGEPAAAPPVSSGEPAPPSVNAPASAQFAPMTLAQFIDQWARDAEVAPFRQQLDLRLLRVVAGDYERARQPLDTVSTQQQAMAARLIESLIVVREEAHGGQPEAAADRVLAEWQQLAETLRPLTELQVPTLAICQQVNGYGRYDRIEPPAFRAGLSSEFVVYCEVRNFLSQQDKDGMYETRFEMRTRILDGLGRTALDIHDADIVDRCRQQRHDCFIPRLVALPPTLSPGEYVLKVTIIDKLGQKLAENRATFRVVTGP